MKRLTKEWFARVLLCISLPAAGSGCAHSEAWPTTTSQASARCWVNSACTPPAIRFDASFAEAMQASFQGPTTAETMLSHPALRGMAKAQAVSESTPAFLESLRLRTQRRMPTWAALNAWRGRGDELVRAADDAGAYLPRPVNQFPGTIYFIVGHGGAAPAPPDIYFDITLPRFERHPSSVPYFVTHEAHHIGYLRLRPLPVVDTTNDVEKLRNVTWALTQMEGMAVHAARERQMQDPAGKEDVDYDTYESEEAGTRVAQRFSAWMSCLNPSRTQHPGDGTNLLDALSAGERLFFRFGALVAARIEATEGREALTATVSRPERFVAAAKEILRTAGTAPCPLDTATAAPAH